MRSLQLLQWIFPIIIYMWNNNLVYLLNQEMIRLMREKRFPAAFKCYHNFQKVESVSSDNLFYKMVIHVHSDSGFRRYQKEMRYFLTLISLVTAILFLAHLYRNSKFMFFWIFLLSEKNWNVSGTSQDCGLFIEVIIFQPHTWTMFNLRVLNEF